jgi:hypothetical protein
MSVHLLHGVQLKIHYLGRRAVLELNLPMMVMVGKNLWSF